MRYPEEIPKAYRRKGNKTEEDKRGQKTRGEDGRREEAFPYQKRVITIPRLANKQDQEIDTDQERGGVKLAFEMKTIQINR